MNSNYDTILLPTSCLDQQLQNVPVDD